MKKIFRMALALALACSTLTYTSCTKDYSEEINDLGKEIENLKSNHEKDIAALNGEISSLKSSISSLESAYKAADAALQKAIDANKENIATNAKGVKDNADAIAALQKTVAENAASIKTLNDKLAAAEKAIEALKADVAKAATKDELSAASKALEEKIEAAKKELNTAIETLKTDLTAKIGNLETAVTALQEGLKAANVAIADNATAIAANAEAIAALQEAQDAIDAALAALSNELRSIVFVPQLYYAGIEAAEYGYAIATELELVSEAHEADDAENNGTTTYIVPDKFHASEGGAVNYYVADSLEAYAIGGKHVLEYNLNPSTFGVENASWELLGKDYDYMVGPFGTFQAGETTPWTPVFECIENNGGIATVGYSIKNADALNQNGVSIVELVATIGEGDDAKVIASDYEAIVAVADTISHLAFIKEKAKTTVDCNLYEDVDVELYGVADSAIVNVMSVPVKYNGGSIDLKEYINIHVTNNLGEEKAYSLAALQEKYGEQITMSFAEFAYYLGGQETSESAYAEVTEDGIYTPQVVKTISKKEYTYEPIPAYEFDPSLNAAEAKKAIEFGISSVGRMPIVRVDLFDGETLILTGWFKTEIVEEVVDLEPVLVPLPEADMLPFVCVGEDGIVADYTVWHQFSDLVLEEGLGMTYKSFVNTYEADGTRNNDGLVDMVVYEFTKDGYVPSEALGSVVYNQDKEGTGINDALTWTLYSLEEGETYEAYVHFTGENVPELYVKFTVSVSAAAKYDFGEKILNEWYDDVNGEALNTVRMNVYVPVATETEPVVGGDVKKFYRDLNNYLVGAEPSINLNEATPEIFDEVADSLLTPSYTYTFSAKQPKINGIQLVKSTDNLELYAGSVAEDNLVAHFEGDTLVYDTTDVAKALLNLYRHDAVAQDSLLYANVQVDITYGECEIPAGTENFHVRFLRPLNVDFNDADVSEESAVDGWNVEVVKFLSAIEDWNHQDVLKEVDGALVANVIKTVDMYAYYQFDSLVLDLKAATRNNWNTKAEDASEDWELVSKVTPNVQLAVGTIDTDEVFTAIEGEDGVYALSIANFSDLEGFVINYKNDRAYIGSFDLKVPVKVSYSWGVIEDVLTIHVNPTADTSKQ